MSKPIVWDWNGFIEGWGRLTLLGDGGSEIIERDFGV